jgi:hypothetical protein
MADRIERAPVSIEAKAILFLVVIMYLLSAIAFVQNNQSQSAYPLLVSLAGLILLSVSILWFFTMQFIVTGSFIEVTYGFFSYRIHKREIARMYVMEKTPWWWGWGLRIGWGTIAVISQRKQSLVIQKKEGAGWFDTIVLSVKNPRAFIRIANANFRKK